QPLDWPFAILVLILVVFGLVMVFSASYAYAYYRMKGDSFLYIRQQAIFAGAGVAAMFALSMVGYHILHKFAWPIMGVTL
ncbi:MAG: FtsW/RodA/SpoVE family cell cycle protein, partial [Ruthenibacterium sp.]